jgi:hypothetical protein
MKVNVEDGMPRWSSPGLSKERYPTIDITPGAIRDGATAKSQTRSCSPPVTTSTLAGPALASLAINLAP